MERSSVLIRHFVLITMVMAEQHSTSPKHFSTTKAIIHVQQEIRSAHVVQLLVLLSNVSELRYCAIENIIMISSISATNERISPTRRQVNSSVVASTVQYQKPTTSSTQPAAAAYRVYAHSEPSPSSFQDGASKVVTQVTEETEVIQIPPQQTQQYNEITYTVQDKQPKFEPISFQVSTMKENIQPYPTTTDNNDPNPFKIFGAKLRSRPSQGIVPSYEDQTMTSYSQQTGSSTQSQYQQSSSLPPVQSHFSKSRQ